jgi:hypothetical protein
VERLGPEVDQDDPDLTAVVGVDQTRAVDHAQPVPGGEPGPGHDKARDTRRQRDRDPGRDGRPLAGSELERLDRAQVVARVALPRARRSDGGGVEEADLHAVELERDGHGSPTLARRPDGAREPSRIVGPNVARLQT